MFDIFSHLSRWHYRFQRLHSCCTRASFLPPLLNYWHWSASSLLPLGLVLTCRVLVVVGAAILTGQNLVSHCEACSQPFPVWSVLLQALGQELSLGLKQKALWVQEEEPFEQKSVHATQQPHPASSDWVAHHPRSPLLHPSHDPSQPQGSPGLQEGPALLHEEEHRCGPCGGSPSLLSVLLHLPSPQDRAPESVLLSTAGFPYALWTPLEGPDPWTLGSAAWADQAWNLHDQFLHVSWCSNQNGMQRKRFE